MAKSRQSGVCGRLATSGLRPRLAALCVAAGLSLVGLATMAPAALAASCPPGTAVTGSQSIDGVKTRVLTATNMTCSSARAVVARNGFNIASRGAYTKGGRYFLGSFACTVTHAPRSGAVRARCVQRRRAFTVAYRLGS